ncbi:MAG: BACON domain-containing protein, partial [Muribaculaceae bacterium]|nr:BACON domain-containing protein [Muribaculaceae bacterium]
MKKTYCRKILPAMLLACLLLLTACSEETEEPQAPQPDFITLLDGETLVADREGGDVMLRFLTNKEWTIELPVTQEHFNGVLEQRSGPAGEVSVSFAALPNTRGAARSTTLRIKAGRASADVKVTQNAV